jgi:hypothetical protein
VFAEATAALMESSDWTLARDAREA